MFIVFFGIFLSSCVKEDLIKKNSLENSPEESLKVIEEWNRLLFRLDRYAFKMRPNGIARSFAYIQLAAYETFVPDLNNYQSNTGLLEGFTIDIPKKEDRVYYNLALNACYAKVINHFMYNLDDLYKNEIDILQLRLEQELFKDISPAVKQNSLDWGTSVANQVIAYSKTDIEGEDQITFPQPNFYEPPVGDGFWSYSDNAERGLFPFWETVRTFVISSDKTSSIAPPLVYNIDQNSPYFRAMQKVYKANNNAKELQGEDLWIAEFWSDDVIDVMLSPPTRQFSIAIQLIKQYELQYDEALALLVKLGFALNDAAVSTWADKYKYMVMRPSVYIQNHIDTSYQTNLYRFIDWPNPSFPAYPSGHSAFAGAAAGVFIQQFGNTTNFTDRTHEGRTEFRGTPRNFNSFDQMAKENAFSRIPLGVHLEMDCTEGLRLGYEISEAINNYKLKK